MYVDIHYCSSALCLYVGVRVFACVSRACVRMCAYVCAGIRACPCVLMHIREKCASSSTRSTALAICDMRHRTYCLNLAQPVCSQCFRRVAVMRRCRHLLQHVQRLSVQADKYLRNQNTDSKYHARHITDGRRSVRRRSLGAERRVE